MLLTEVHNNIMMHIVSQVQLITDKFEGNWWNNKENEDHYEAHKLMAQYAVASSVASELRRKIDKVKLDLDGIVEILGSDSKPEPGITKQIYRNDMLTFSKKQNAEGVMVSVKELEIELNKLGVDPSIISKAIKNAERPRKGNTYYIVSTSEEI